MGFGEWLVSGWGDAWAQWQHPLTSIQNSLLSSAGMPTTPIPGSTSYPSVGTNGADPTDGSSTSDDDDSTNWWLVVIVGIVAVLAIGFLLKEAREL